MSAVGELPVESVATYLVPESLSRGNSRKGFALTLEEIPAPELPVVDPEVPSETDELYISLPAVLTPKTPPQGFFKEPSSKSTSGSPSTDKHEFLSKEFVQPINSEIDTSPPIASVKGAADMFQKNIESHLEGQHSMEDMKRKNKEAAERKKKEKEDAEYRLAHPELFPEPEPMSPMTDSSMSPNPSESVASPGGYLGQAMSLTDELNAGTVTAMVIDAIDGKDSPKGAPKTAKDASPAAQVAAAVKTLAKDAPAMAAQQMGAGGAPHEEQQAQAPPVQNGNFNCNCVIA